MEKDFFINEKENSATWMYEYDLWKNPGIFMTLGKVFLLCSLVPAIIVFFVTIGDGFTDAVTLFFKIYGIVAGIIIGLLIIAYPIVTIIKGAKYIVIFEMDDLGITHKEMEKQFNKMQAIEYIGTLIGTTTGNITTVASNLIASTHTSTHSDFRKVRKVIVKKSKNTVKLVTSDMYHNEIYISDNNFDYVLNYILERCPKNIVKKGA